MNTPRLLQAPAAPVASTLFHERLNQELRQVVDMGISVQANFNTICAIEYLKSYNVDAGLIERVLLHPEQRRKTQH